LFNLLDKIRLKFYLLLALREWLSEEAKKVCRRSEGIIPLDFKEVSYENCYKWND
jgi:hypothetical protein